MLRRVTAIRLSPTVLVFALALACRAERAPGAEATVDPAASGPATNGFRVLAPGVMRVVDPERKRDEDSSLHDIVELLAVDPGFTWAKGIRFEHQVWALEFRYKPVRFVEVDVPVPGGRLARKQLWYLLYSVRNPGPDSVEFRPQFSLEGRDIKRTYPDSLLQVAIPEIRLREDPRRALANTVEMAQEIPSSADGIDRSVWGVAIWEDVDPRTDLFSIYVGGLTNAYRWRDEPGGRVVERKVLELNFWRPGDDVDGHEDEIRIGAPGGVDYRWVYR